LSNSKKFDQHLIFASESLLGIFLLLPHHKVLILHAQYSPDFMMYAAMCLLYKYHTSSHPLSYDMEILRHNSTYDMIPSSHIF